MLFAPKERGQGLVELAILAALIVFCITVIVLLPDCGGDWKAAVRFIVRLFRGVCE